MKLSAVVAALCLLLSVSWQQKAPSAVEPFKIVGNIYYVGTSDPTAYLITTSEGHILIDTTYAHTESFVRNSIRALGFKLEDVKIILSSHAHLDHVGGHAAMKRATGAHVHATEQDAINLESGGAKAFHQTGRFEPVTVTRRLKDGEAVRLGGVSLTAHVLPGHTEGNTAWTTTVTDGEKTYNVLFAPSMSINPGVRMVNYPPWPTIADAYAGSFAKLKKLPCDIFLAPHASFFDLESKRRRLSSASVNPFVDPEGFRDFVGSLETSYADQLRKEKAGGRPGLK
jgi:metallo-beta-lactamase class B